ncbi:hypothetical protein ACI797_15440 [Geodermatophilus sp. SYSU D00691]
MNRRAAVAGLAGIFFAAAVGAASPAAADKPVRGCPPPFELYGYAELLAFAENEIGDPDPQAAVASVLAAFDKNGDRALCLAFQNKNAAPYPNAIDNVANR